MDEDVDQTRAREEMGGVEAQRRKREQKARREVIKSEKKKQKTRRSNAAALSGKPKPLCRSCLDGLALLLLFHLEQQCPVDVRQDATKGDRRADERVELFVAADGQLQMPRRDPLDLEVLCGVLSQHVSKAP